MTSLECNKKPVKLKVFISAYACEPVKGSEPGIGWNVVTGLSRYHDVHVLTRANNKEIIENHLKIGSFPNLTFHYYDLPKTISFWKNKRRGYRFYYYLWQYFSFMHFKKFVNENNFDIVHHLTFANFAMPAPFVFLRPISIWGPVRKLEIPDVIFESLPPRIWLKERLRQISIWFLTHLEPGRILTQVKTNWILETPDKHIQSCFPDNYKTKIINLPQTGINTSDPEYILSNNIKKNHLIRLVICSEFLHWKGVTYSAEVFSRIALKRDDVELIICGYGPEENEMRRIFKHYNVTDKVSFMGYLNKKDMLNTLNQCDILLYPSYHHGLATVILQAMHLGIPIIALRGDTISSVVDGECGLVADGYNINDILNNLESLTLNLIEDKDLRVKLGDKGKEMIKNTYEWSQIIKSLDSIYRQIYLLKYPYKL